MSGQRSMWARLGAGTALGLSLILLSASGCATKSNTKGKVSYQGKTLDGGSLAFVTSDGKVFRSPIKEDGSYEVVNCPPGEVKITVDTPKNEMRGMDPSQFSRPPKDIKPPENVNTVKWPTVIVPDQFKEADKTDLKYTVVSGDQEHNVEIK
jgi:hypothetical protein